MTDVQIATRFPGGTVHRVQRWKKDKGIPTLSRWMRHELPPIEGTIRSLLVGSMLGDGRLVRRVHATHYMERHSEAQKPYLEWKAKIWGSWAKEIKPVPDKRGYLQVRMETHAHALLNSWQEMFYANHHKGWKRFIPGVVDLVDAFALTVWYLDDGNAGWWPNISFGADESSHQTACLIFDKFGLHPRWQKLKDTNGQFHMEREDTALRFLDIICPHVPSCMAYKLGPFGFQGPHYRVRQKMEESRLRDMAERGVPIRRIARLLGVGSSTVGRWLEEFHIPHPRKKGRPPV